jgi:hypothetical protein
MKTFICLSLAFALAASAAVVSVTSSQWNASAERTANYLY